MEKKIIKKKRLKSNQKKTKSSFWKKSKSHRFQNKCNPSVSLKIITTQIKKRNLTLSDQIKNQIELITKEN